MKTHGPGGIALALILASTVHSLAAEADDKKPTIFESLADNGISIRKTLSGPAKPATFGYNRTDTDDFATAQFAVVYFSPRPISEGKNYYLGFQSAVEGNLSGESDARANNSLKASAALVHLYTLDPKTITGGLFTRFGPAYEMSKNLKIQNLYAELELAPIYRPTGMAAYTPIAKDVFFSWSPIFAVQAGGNLRRDEATFEQSNTIVRLVPQIHFTLDFPGVAKAVGLHGVKATASEKLYYLAEESNHRKNDMFESGLQFSFTKEFSLNLTYKKGREPPTYNDVREMAVMFGLKVGSGGLFEPGP